MSNDRALTPYQPGGALALDSLEDLSRFGKVLYESGLFPDVKSQAQAIVKILAGREIGIPPMESMTTIDVVQGRVRYSAALMARIIKRDSERGGYDYQVVQLTNEICEIQFLRAGKPLTPTSTYTMDDAKQAKLAGKDNYQTHPRNMLFARALTNGAKWHCPHLFGSASIVGEATTELEDDGGVIITGPTPPTVEQVETEAARNTAMPAPPRAASRRFHTQQPEPAQAARTYEQVFGEGNEAAPDPAPSNDSPPDDPTTAEEVTMEELEGLGTAMPPAIADMLRGFAATYYKPEPLSWQDDPKKRAAKAKETMDRLKLFRFTVPEVYGLMVLLHFAATGEVLDGEEAAAHVSAHFLIGLQTCEDSAIDALHEAARWYVGRNGKGGRDASLDRR